MDLVVCTLDQRPEAEQQLWGLSPEWPRFMLEDPVADYYFADVEQAFPEFVLIAWDASDPDRILPRGFSVPSPSGRRPGARSCPR